MNTWTRRRISVLLAALALLACGRSARQAEAPQADTLAPEPAPVATPVPPPAEPEPPPPQAAPPAKPAPVAAAAPKPTAAPAPAADPYHRAPRDTVDVDTYNGWKQYEINCARCHGEYGVGTTFAPALVVSLKNDGTVPTPELFLTVVCAGRPEKGMPGWCALGLEMDKMQKMYQYLKARADGNIGPGRPAVRD